MRFFPDNEEEISLIKFIAEYQYINVRLFNINGIEYLTYKITKEHDNRYIASVIYDIQKETIYKNFIVLIDDINKINIKYFAFGYNSVLLIEDTEINREKLKYLHSIRWKELIDKNFKGAYLSEYNFCEYENNEGKYINTFYFIDAEKINRFRYFIKESSNKRAYIICNVELENKLRKELPTAHYCVVELNEYIDKDQRIYN